MTDPSYTHIAIVADRSGSMGDVADPPATKAERTTEGIHKLVHDQRQQPGRVTFSLTDFDTARTVIESYGPGDRTLAWSCSPRWGTALLDAVGDTISATGRKLSELCEGERPGKVIVVIATDGLENSSFEYRKQQVADMIAHQRERYNWDFMYIGADIDAFAEAGRIGVPVASTLPTVGWNLPAAYASTSDAISRTRGSVAAGAAGASVFYTDEEREKSGGKK